RRDEWIELAERIGGETRPAIVAGPADHVGAHGIQLDVTHAGEQVSLRVDEAGMKATFPKRAAALVTIIEPWLPGHDNALSRVAVATRMRAPSGREGNQANRL